ncbi:MAG: YeeE/YedE family protein, partial [Vicinamibacterales bacterium]
QLVGWRQVALFLVGAGAGIVLYHAAFGFTSAFRVFISDRRGAGLRAQMIMLAATTLLFIPALAAGSLFGQPVRGNFAPLGVPVLAGAFIFGIGMQLGGGCASGTLFAVGGGNLRMIVTLFFFVVGSVVGVAHFPWWEQTPQAPALSLLATFGPLGAIAASFAIFGGVAWMSTVLERARHGRLLPAPLAPRTGLARVLHGPWSLVAGALGLVAVNVATLALAGRPWGITSAFALWGSKAADRLGLDVASWPYWADPARQLSLQASVFQDVTSVMDVGIILGAILAAGLAGRFGARTARLTAPSLAGAVVGGLMLGYGARLAYGCNIGAYFSGVASGSLHGWLWFAAALAGSVIGTRLRPMFDLPVERTPSSC